MIGKCSADQPRSVQTDAGSTLSRLVLAWSAALLVAFSPVAGQAVTDARDYAVLVSATVQSSPAQIRLTWPQDTFAIPASYVISRKSPTATVWTSLATLSGTETNYLDANVAVGTQYEYQVQKTAAGYSGYGYVLAGIEAPLIEARGKLLLIVDNTYANDLTSELARLQQDLEGDGWQVIRHDVNRNDTVLSVKALIKADYAADPANVRSVFLFGHVPVPYSGDIVPDGHSPNHRGAWPADVYYADANTDWNDASISSTNASDARNVNRPGDGKFDMSTVTTLADLEVGRVDLANLPSFGLSEKELLRQYLNKDHNFRHKITTVQPRGLVVDYFGTQSGSAFAATGWRNFSAFFGAPNVVASSNWFPTLATNSYLWAYGCGGGTFTSASGVGTTADFAANDPKAVFTFLFGSYFGDWDTTNNFMRAALATPTYTLTSAWGGRPHWFVHHMALGGTIGRSTRLSQNNMSGSPYKQINAGAGQIHVALMGDPTLRLHPIAPPTAVNASVNDTQVTLTWTASSDAALGYLIYRRADAAEPFMRVNGLPINDTSFTDQLPGEGNYTYMVRALRLENSGSGSYYNASQGAFTTVGVTEAALHFAPFADQTVELGDEWTFATPTASSGCGSVTVNVIATETNLTCGGSFVATRIWQALDACSAEIFLTNSVTVSDTTAPAVESTGDKSIELGVAWAFDLPTATDASGPVTINVLNTTTNPVAGNTLSTTRTWSITDVCGNATEVSQTVSVGDTTPPTLSSPGDKTVELGSEWTFDPPTASDSGGEVTVAVVDVVTNTPRANALSITCTWVASDPSGNEAQCSQTVTVDDTTAPTLVVPANKAVTEDAEWDFDQPTATDAGGEVTITILNTVTNGNVATRTWSAVDAAGNATTGSQSVEVVAPADVTITAVDDTASEAGDTGEFLITRNGSTAMALTISLSYRGNAENGTDYIALPTEITIPIGASSASLILTPVADVTPEKTESVTVTVETSKAYVPTGPRNATVRIADVTAKRK